VFRATRLTKHLAATAAAVALLATAACGSGAGGDSDGSVTLKFSYFTSQNNPLAQTWDAWMDEVTERSNGSIKFERFWDGTLLTGDAVLDGLKDGRADIAQVTPTFYAGKFPLTAVNELPFGTNNVGAVSAAMSSLIKTNDALAKEWSKQGLKSIAWNVGGASAIVSNRKITSASDFDGLKIRGMDRGSRALKANGANVLAIAPAELYTSMERGLLDATYGVQFGALPSLKLEEVGKYVVDASTGAQTASTLAMSESGWNKLSDEQKKIIGEVSTKVPMMYFEKNRAAEDAACKTFTDKGVELSSLDPTEVAKLREIGEKPVVDGWLAEVEKAGQDGAAFRTEYNTAVEKAAPDFQDGDKSGVARCIESQ
jgi:TRAP-type C4-dicarboxylate transport system substrate-binding protein